MSDFFGRGPAREPERDGQNEREGAPLEPEGRWLRRRLVSGVTAVTTVVEGGFRAATVGAAMVASLEPLHVLISIDSESQMVEWLTRAGVFGMSILPWREQFIADQFAGYAPRASRTFDRIPHFVAATGAPLLSGSIAWADCTVDGSFETGDHHCFVGRAVAVGRGDGDTDDPLIYFFSRYRRLV